MDLHFTEAEPTAEERAAVDSELGPSDVASRDSLLPVLQSIQAHIGWISPGALNHACRRLGVPPADAFGVADFYSLFSLTPRAPVVLHVCDDIGCLAKGAAELCERIAEKYGPPGSACAGGKATWLRSPCLGMCERAPVAMVTVAGERPVQRAMAPAVIEDIEAVLEEGQVTGVRSPRLFDTRLSVPQVGTPGLRLLGRVGKISPESLYDYRSHGGYEALRRALAMGPDAVIREVSESRLLGRGGAAFPAGKKWGAFDASGTVARAHYLVCNADESEPGTFKDRVMMEGDPFALVEAMTIAGFATGCRKGYIYIRGEYHLARERLATAIRQARQSELLGQNIMGHGIQFDIEMRCGAGAYICGEETAMLNSIEGFRGEPRSKPPFPTQVGLFGKPTLVNNVETLVNVLPIVLEGGAKFASQGTLHSAGTKLFCVSGHAASPGVYEVGFGATLRQVIDLAGGVAGSGRLQAVLLGGAAGTFVSPEDLDIPLTFEGTRTIGATLGSGVVMLFDDTVDLKRILLRIASFFRDESCGQCVPCRVGTVRQEELLQRLSSGRPLGSVGDELELVREMGQAMRDASICGLGQTATSAVESALARWDLFKEERE